MFGRNRLYLFMLLVLAASLAAIGGTARAATAASGVDLSHGALFTESNAASGNAVLVFPKTADGSPSPTWISVPTGGAGAGASLGSQGAVTLSPDGSQLFAVNAGSNSISAFAVTNNALTLENVVWSGGTDPISLTTHDHVLYVLNAGSSTISGYSIGHSGLTALPGSTQALTPGASSPEQIGFSPDGSLLLVTEKASSTIDTFQVGGNNLAGPAQSHSSNGGGPYGFAFDNHGDVLVSDAGLGAASSYTVSKTGGLSPIGGPASTNGQSAPCWLILTNDGRFAYTADAGSGTISGYSDSNGQLSLLNPSGISANIGVGSHPLDEAVGTRGGQYLYILADGFHQLQTYRIDGSGNLTWVSSIPGLPVADGGLASL